MNGTGNRERRYDEAILITNRADNHSIHHMLAGIHEGLLGIGIASRLCIVEPDGSDLGSFMELVAKAGPRTFLIDLNGKMRFESTKKLKKFSFLTDHPYALMEYILATPADGVLGLVDRTHLGFLGAIGDRHRAVFFPHAGPDPEPDSLAMEDRDIEALFMGRLETSPSIGDLRDGLAASPEIVRRIVTAAAEAAAESVPLYDALLMACERHSVDAGDLGLDGLTTAIGAASAWAEAHNRHKVLTSLGNVPVTLVGAVSDGFFERPPANITFLGPRTFDECQDLMRRSKLIVNSVTVFPDGSHERIWYGMAKGCAIATDFSHFVAEDFIAGESILFWPEKGREISEMVAAAVADPDRLREMAAAAGSVYAAKHTWRKRVRIIDEVLNG